MAIKSFCAGLIRKIWLSFAILLVTLAIILSAIRLGLPYANDFKEHIVTWFEQKFDQPIDIEYLAADWRGNGPQIEMKGFRFKRQLEQDSPVLVDISQVNLELDFWQTLLQRSLVVKNFVLEGVDVQVDTDKLNAAKQSGDNFALFSLFEDIFLEQFQRFDVQNSHVTIITPDKAAHQIKIHQLKWFNQNKNHQGVGEFSLEGIEADKLGFVLDLTDDGIETYSGQFYVKSDGVDLAPWVKPYLAKQVDNIHSRLKFEAWLDIKKSALSRFLLNFDPSPLNWYVGNQLHEFEMVSGQIQANFLDANPLWHFSDMSFAAGQQLWSGLDIHLKKQAKTWKMYSPRVNLTPIKAVASLFDLPNNAKQFIQAMSGEPSIDNLHLNYQNKKRWKLHADVADVSWQEILSVPQVSGLKAKVSAKPGTIVSAWSLPESELAWESLFTKKLKLKSATAISIFNYQDDDWKLKFPHIELDLAQLNLRTALSLSPDVNNDLELAVFSEIGEVNIGAVADFLPQKLIGQQTSDYLERALESGKITSGQLIWQGKLNDYPFKQNQGIFKAQLAVEKTRFAFQPDWPAADNVDLTLTFLNKSLLFDSQKANLLNAQLITLDAKIDDLTSKDASLQLNAQLAAKGAAVTEVMLQSSLQNSVGSALEQAQVEGDVKVNLDLFIPLHRSQDLNVSGDVVFDQNKITIAKTGFVFQRVNGLLEFDMDKLVGKKMTFDWGPVPYQMDFNSLQTPAGYQLNFDLLGDWPLDAILTQAGFLNMADRLKGNAHVDGHLEILLGQNDDFNFNLNVASDMHGVTLKLPEPYQKSASQLKITNLIINGDNERALMELTAGNNLSFSAVLPYEMAKFSRAYLVLGEHVLSPPATGFNISAHLDDIDFPQYANFINDLTTDLGQLEKSTDGTAIIDLPERIRGEVKQLELGPLTWHDVNFETQRGGQSWQTQINAKEFRGSVTAFDNWQQQGLSIAAQQLYLTLPTENETETTDNNAINNETLSGYSAADIRNIFDAIPRIQFSCESCQLDQKNLGKVSFDISRASPNDLLLNNFKLNYRQHQIAASGLWRLDKQSRSSTQLRGQISSSDFGHWLRDYQLSSAIRDSSIKADFSFNWPQPPVNLSYQYLNGDLNWRLGEGYFTEVSDKGARILSMLSLDSLVRKLKLDFRDVFSKGLFYNQMTGKVKLTNGLAYTDNTKMDGVAGNMEVKGSTDLVSQELNYDVRFSPKVTSSLPVLIAWMVNPVTGIAALAIDQVLESADVISQIKFKISGTIDKPKVIETGRESREVKLPAQPSKGTPKKAK